MFYKKGDVTKNCTFIILIIIAALVTILVRPGSAVENYEAVKVVVPFTIDGDLGDWAGIKGVFLTGSTDVTGTLDGKDLYRDWETLGEETWENNADMSVTWYAAWDEDNFYFACVVSDEKHKNTQSGADIWSGDSIQFTIDPVNAKGEYLNKVYEYGYALTTRTEIWRWHTHTATGGENSTFAVARDDIVGTTTYEVAIPKDDILPIKLVVGNVIGFSFIANEQDFSEGQGGWLGWGAHAIVYEKRAYKLNDLTLSVEVVTGR